MKQLLIIPKINEIDEYRKLADERNLGFEFNDFFVPETIISKEETDRLIREYAPDKKRYCTSHGAFYEVIVSSFDPEMKALSEYRVERSIQIACELGCKKVGFHTNLEPFLTQDYYLDNWLECNTAFFKLMCEKYPDIEILMENMFDNDPYMLGKLVRAVGKDNFRVCLDMAHAFLSDTPIEDWIKELDPYISHLHINNNDSKTDLHRALDDGTIDYSKYIDYLDAFRGSVLIEVPDLQRVLASLDYLDRMGIKHD